MRSLLVAILFFSVQLFAATAPGYTFPSGGAASGPAGGDLTGTYPNPTVATSAITSAKIADGAIVNVDVNASASIAGTKVSPAFGAQNISNTGTIIASSDISSGSLLTLHSGGTFGEISANAADNGLWFWTGKNNGGGVAIRNNGSYDNVALGASNGLVWTEAADNAYNANLDTGINRAAPGVIEINSGTPTGKGFIKFNLTGGVVGTVTNNSVDALCVGEFVQTLVPIGSAVSLTTATTADVTSISLTAGDWDVDGNVNFTTTAATFSALTAGITATSVTLPTDGSEVYSGVQGTALSAKDSVTMPRKRISLAATTTVYLDSKATFSVGAVAAYGGISARRVR